MPHSSISGHSKHRRRDAVKQTSIPSAAPRSRASVGSSSEGSNAGGSTVRLRPRSNGVTRPLFLWTPGALETSSEKSTATAKQNQTARVPPNVFEFLEKDGSSDDSSSEEEGGFPEAVHPRTSTVQITGSSAGPRQNANSPARFSFDPGTPTRKKSPDRTSSVTSKESTDFQPATPPDVSPATIPLKLAGDQIGTQRLRLAGAYSPVESPVESPAATEEQNFDLSVPENYYISSRERDPQQEQSSSPPIPESGRTTPSSDSKKEKKIEKKYSVRAGYEYLASKLTPSKDGEKPLPPLYRKFESLNHRVLLHLQDEIAQMEEDLQVLDEYEEMHRVAAAQHEGIQPMPASRRMDAQAQSFSSLHQRRMDLLGKLILKTEQYKKYLVWLDTHSGHVSAAWLGKDNALCAYSKVVQTLPHASERDIETYRAWMKENGPIAKPETRFLEHNLDLISLSPRPVLTTAIYSTVAITSAAIMVPLLAFGTISEFLGRMVVVMIIGGATTIFAANAGAERLIDPRDGWRCAAIYFSFMTIAAIFIR